MPDEKKTTEKTEVTTETKERWGSPSEYKKETTVTTEKKVEKDDDPVIIIENN